MVFPSKSLSDFVMRASAFAIFATSLNLLVGYAGMVSFGHGLFFGLGAYSFALLMQKLGTSIPVAFALTVVINALVAAVVGAICVRLKEIYFSFLTLAFQMLLYSLIIAVDRGYRRGPGLTGGVPRPPFLGVRLDDPHHLYLFCCTTLVVSLFLMWHLVQSPFGYTLRMIRDNPRRASFLGIPGLARSMYWPSSSPVCSAGSAACSSAFSYRAPIPDFAYWTVSGEAVFMIMLGGINVFFGPLVGAALVAAAERLRHQGDRTLQPGPRDHHSHFRPRSAQGIAGVRPAGMEEIRIRRAGNRKTAQGPLRRN